MDRKNKSPVWNVFFKDVANNRSTCSQCGKEFKYRYTTTNLRDHLKRYHPEWLPESSENSSACNNSSQSVVPYSSERLERFSADSENASYLSAITEECDIGRKNKSSVWEVFVKDADSKNVTCTLCEKEFKFWNNTTNLRAHLKRSHPDWRPQNQINIVENVELDYEEEQDVLDTRRSSTSSTESIIVPGVGSLPDSDSNLWKVFSKSNDDKGVFCALCAKECKSLIDESSMLDHMQRLHPNWKLESDIVVCNQEEPDEVVKEDFNDAVVSNVLVVQQERKNRSPVWDVFVKDPAKKRTTCLLCNKGFKCFSNTANLLDHLRRIHPNWKQESRNADIRNENLYHKRPTIARISNSSLSDNSNLKPSLNYIQSALALSNVPFDMKSKRVDKLIGEMICMDFQNLSIVEDLGFKKLVKELVPNYSPPSRKLIVKQTLPQLYDDVSKHLHHALEKCKYVAISVELWTNHSIEGFMTLYVHYFSNEKYTSSVLHTERINTDHSSADLATVIYSILNDHWQIFDKITAIVADDDAAVKSACEMLNITHIPCVGQLINNIITEELTGNDVAQNLLQHCLNLVGHFKLNTSAADVLRSIQSQQGLPVLNLKQVAPTRWNSALHMAQRLLEVKNPLSEAIASIDNFPESVEPLTDTDWEHLKDFIEVLKPFELMTSELSADSYCNLSKVIPLIRGVQSSLQQAKCVSDLGSVMRKSLLEKLDTRFAIYEKYSIPSVATLLDPRFKRAGLGVEAVETASSFVIEQLSALKNAAAAQNQNGTLTDEKSAQSNSGIWNFLEKKVKESQKALTTSAEVIVKQYLDLPYYNRHECPFKFWIGQSSLEPELADIAMKFMCIPATSFPAERFYSKNGINITERRNRMTTKHFNTIIFLNKNL